MITRASARRSTQGPFEKICGAAGSAGRRRAGGFRFALATAARAAVGRPEHVAQAAARRRILIRRTSLMPIAAVAALVLVAGSCGGGPGMRTARRRPTARPRPRQPRPASRTRASIPRHRCAGPDRRHARPARRCAGDGHVARGGKSGCKYRRIGCECGCKRRRCAGAAAAGRRPGALAIELFGGFLGGHPRCSRTARLCGQWPGQQREDHFRRRAAARVPGIRAAACSWKSTTAPWRSVRNSSPATWRASKPARTVSCGAIRAPIKRTVRRRAARARTANGGLVSKIIEPLARRSRRIAGASRRPGSSWSASRAKFSRATATRNFACRSSSKRSCSSARSAISRTSSRRRCSASSIRARITSRCVPKLPRASRAR